MRVILPLALAVSSGCLSTDVWADYSSGLDAYKRGDYAVAMHEWRALAEDGHAQAQTSLGWLYLNGRGVVRDYAQARQYFEQAAAQGQAVAQYNLAQLYHGGQGGPQDDVQACHWYEKAALQGNVDAQVNLGRCITTVVDAVRIISKLYSGFFWLPNKETRSPSQNSALCTSMEKA